MFKKALCLSLVRDGNIGSLLANAKGTLRVTNQPKQLIIIGSREPGLNTHSL